MEVELAMSVRPMLAGAQPSEHLAISAPALLLVFIAVVVAVAVAKDPKLAAPIGAAAAVAAVLVVALTP
ncbi:hypothetical protein ACQP1W_01030 [Spirillospora sp. CA-255316]